ncbi:hypothetical protein ABT158_01435 [Nonomuraea sp. NPDC001636]
MSVSDPPDTKFVDSSHKECSLDGALKLYHLPDNGKKSDDVGYN